MAVEQRLGQVNIGLPEELGQQMKPSFFPSEIEMAKPGIPVESPRRRAVPDIPNPIIIPIPTRVPITEPGQPAKMPRIPVPAGR